MKPIHFPEVTKKIGGEIPVAEDYGILLSKWQMSWRERFECFWRGTIWLAVKGENMPPTLISGNQEFKIINHSFAKKTMPNIADREATNYPDFDYPNQSWTKTTEETKRILKRKGLFLSYNYTIVSDSYCVCAYDLLNDTWVASWNLRDWFTLAYRSEIENKFLQRRIFILKLRYQIGELPSLI